MDATAETEAVARKLVEEYNRGTPDWVETCHAEDTRWTELPLFGGKADAVVPWLIVRGAASGASVKRGSAMISASGRRVRALSLARGRLLVKTALRPLTRSSSSSGGALWGSSPASWYASI